MYCDIKHRASLFIAQNRADMAPCKAGGTSAILDSDISVLATGIY